MSTPSEHLSESRRKIPRDEWSTIAARYSKGESLASIARTYNCTAPAVRYIVRQVRTREPGEPQSAHSASPEGRALRAGTDPTETRHPRARPLEQSEPSGQRLGATAGCLDGSLRELMTLEISAFLVAFDAVFAQGGEDALANLRSATDRLLRSAARVRIELERTTNPDSGNGATTGRARAKSRI